MNRTILSALIAVPLAAALSVGCAAFDDNDGETGIGGDSDAVTFPISEDSRFEQVTIDVRADAFKGDADVPGPCACATEECVQEYLDPLLGCDVCVTFLCGDSSTVHGCSACDYQPTTWHDDGPRAR